MYEKNKIFFPHHAEDRVDFLAYSDLAELLLRVTEETEDESGSYSLSAVTVIPTEITRSSVGGASKTDGSRCADLL